MAIFKCKMCGANLNIEKGVTTAECEYCGTTQTLPKTENENLQALFNRANTLRIKSEFDKAEKIYEKIIQTDAAQAEAYWGLILCKYGIEYVDDPATLKRIPTCHRASYDSIIADEDYKATLEHADAAQRAVYEEEAKEIDRLQKEILALAQKEEKYDVFICYKETDEDGKRTQDSVIANDIYYQLTQEGFKVFYAAITLEGKLGSAYEPIIFAALNSAKVMLCIGTRPEYFSAVWVKNEWSRFLKIISKDRSKLLIPCYRDMDAYELPEEFAHLQAQDMSKIGFINDVIRGIGKVLRKDDKKPSATATATPQAFAAAPVNTAPLLRRVFIFLEDGKWDEANEYCEKVLDMEPECAEAYFGELMAAMRVRTREELANQKRALDQCDSYQKVMRYGSEELKKELLGYKESVDKTIEAERLEKAYQEAREKMIASKTEEQILQAAENLKQLGEYKDCPKLVAMCLEKVEKMAQAAREKAERERIAREEAARKREEEEKERLRREEIARKEAEIREQERKKKRAKIEIIGLLSFFAVILLILLITLVIIPQVALSNGDYKTYIDIYGIEEFEISEGTTTIPRFAFYGCDSLKSVTIPASVTSIEDEAFRFCENLETVTFAEGSKLKSIGEWAFNCCGSLTSITIPESVTSIGEGAFYCCNGLRVINFNAIAAEYTSQYSAYSCFGSGGSSLTQKITLNIGGKVTKISQYYFDRSAIETINIAEGSQLESIGSEAFYNCSSLTLITIPSSVTSIGEYAFSGCSSLTSVTFEQTSGWKCSSNTISASDLANTATAAKYLTSTYFYNNWKRS